MRKVSELTICKDDYRNDNDFENAIKRAILVLLENGYISTIRYDDKALGVIVIEYNYANQDFGSYYPHWLLPEEAMSVTYREDRI